MSEKYLHYSHGRTVLDRESDNAAILDHTLPLITRTAARERPREVILVTDTYSETEPIAFDGRTVYKAHTFVVFNYTESDGPLRVEIAAPTIDGKTQGLAVAVTEYSTIWEDFGQPDFPSKPAHTQRQTSVFRARNIRNAQLFDLHTGVLDESTDQLKPPQSALEALWLLNGMSSDNPDLLTHFATLGDIKHPSFGTSHEFAISLLTTRSLGLSAADLSQVPTQAMKDGADWAMMKRIQRRGPWQMSSITDIGHFVYEAPLPRSETTGQVSRTFRALYEIVRLDVDIYRATLVKRWFGRGFMRAITDPKGKRKELRLSREPEWTSDTLSIEERKMDLRNYV